MRTHIFGASIAVLAACVAFGQGSAPPQAPNKAAYEGKPVEGSTDAVRLFYFTHGETPQEIQEFVNLVRTMAEIQRASTYFERRTIALRGTSSQIALAEWLFAGLDQPVDAAGAAKTAAYDFPLSTGGVEAVRLFSLSRFEPPENLQHMMNLIRTITDMPRIYTYAPRRAIVARGTPAQIAVTEWLVRVLDKAVAPTPARTEAYEDSGDSRQGPAIRLFFVPAAETSQELHEVLSMIRTTADINRVYAYPPVRMIALRGTAAQADLAQWLVKRLETTAGPASAK